MFKPSRRLLLSVAQVGAAIFAGLLFWQSGCGSSGSSNPSQEPAWGPVRVFPGAEGFGTMTPAGRGGQIIKVTNLNDSGIGSLRAAIKAGGRRIIVFEVSGTIILSSDLIISNPYVTIAGQTSPSPGITLRRGGLKIFTNDVLIQHIRVRTGDESSKSNISSRDGIEISKWANNIVIDHCSISWAIDENISAIKVSDITISNCIISEALSFSFNKKGEHSKGILVAYSAERVSLLRNLYAHNNDRNPAFKDDSSGMSVNEVYYNFGFAGARMSYNEAPYMTTKPLRYSNIGGVYKAGLSTNLAVGVDAVFYFHPSVVQPSAVFLSDYLLLPSSLPVMSEAPIVLVNSPPVWDDSLTVMPAISTEAYVLANAGARPADRDEVDIRIVNDVLYGTGHIIDTPSQVGGWPYLPVNYRPFTIPINPDADDNGNGYSNIEEVLHLMAAQVEGR